MDKNLDAEMTNTGMQITDGSKWFSVPKINSKMVIAIEIPQAAK
jgi:hypothetical protein